jgi:RNAse (barnase) inhibitor barstar
MTRKAKEVAFHFDERDLARRSREHVEVRIPRSIATKKALLAELDTGLSFPDYFGGNWDALWECICDLSWLRPVQVVVIHDDLPLKDEPTQLQTYLSIMSDAIGYWANKPEHELIVVFPRETEQSVRTLLST